MQYRKNLIKIVCIVLVILLVYRIYGYENQGQKNSHSLRSSALLSRKTSQLDNVVVLQHAQSLSKKGYLKKTKGGVVYLQVSDHYIHKIYPLILASLNTDDKQCLQPAPLPAHVSLYRTKKPLLFVHKKFDFNIEDYIKVNIIKKHKQMLVKETWYELEVNAPDLVAADKKIEFPDELHISIAVAKRNADTNECLY